MGQKSAMERYATRIALPRHGGCDEFIADEIEKWAKVMKFSNAKPD